MVEFTTRQALRVYTENLPNGGKSGYLSQRLRRRQAPTVPWALYLADSTGHYHWLGFDLDDHGGTHAAEVAADLLLLTSWLEDQQIPHLVCASGGGAGRHIWIRLSTRVWHQQVAEMAEILAARLRTLDHGMLKNPTAGVLRGPGSPHKNGTSRSVPLPAAGRTAEDSLEWMLEGTHGPRLVGELKRWALTLPIVRRIEKRAPRRAGTKSSPPARTGAPAQTATAAQTALVRAAEKRCPLPPTIRRLVAHEPHTSVDASRPAFAILIAMAHVGWTETEVTAAAFVYPGLLHLVSERIETTMRVPRSDPQIHIERQWAKARATARSRPPRYVWGTAPAPADITGLVAGAAAAIQAAPLFHGVRGATRTAVIYALLDQVTTSGRQTVDLSIRRWSLACGASRGDTHRVILELIAAGWIVRTAESDGPLAATYTLGSAAVSAGQHDGTQRPQAARAGGKHTAAISEFLAHLRADVWTAPALGSAGASAHYELSRGLPRTVGELAAAAHLDQQTVTGVLEVLETVGLVEDLGGRWCANTGAGLLAYAADVLGVAGVLEERRVRYTAESAVWRWWCAEQQVRQREVAGPLPIRLYGRFPTTVTGRCDWAAAMGLVLSGAHQMQLDLAG